MMEWSMASQEPELSKLSAIFKRQLVILLRANLTQSRISITSKNGRGQKNVAVGFDRVDDHVTGVSVAMPLKLISGPIKKTWGQN